MGKRKSNNLSPSVTQSTRSTRAKAVQSKNDSKSVANHSITDDEWASLSSFSCRHLDGHESGSGSDREQLSDESDGHESDSAREEVDVVLGNAMGVQSHGSAEMPATQVFVSGRWHPSKLEKVIGRRVIDNTELTTLQLSAFSERSKDALQKMADSDVCTRLRELEFGGGHWTSHLEQPMRALLTKATQLETLALYNSWLHVEACRAAVRGLRHHTALRKLNIYDVDFCCGTSRNSCESNKGGQTSQKWPLKGSAGYVMSKLIGNLTMLTHLEVLSRESHVMEDGVAQGMGNLLARNSALQCINMRAMEWSKNSMKLFAEGLAKNTTLRTLRMPYNMLYDTSIVQLVNALASNSTLQELDLSQLNEALFSLHEAAANRLDKASIANAFAKMLSTNRGLVRVSLPPLDADCGKIAGGLAHNSTLLHMDLHSSDMTPGAMEEIAQGLRRNSTLETLCISPDNSENSEGKKSIIASIGRILEGDGALRHILFPSNYLKDKQAKPLADALMQTCALRYLDVSDHNFTHKGVEQLCRVAMHNTSLTGLNLGELSDETSAKLVADLLTRNTTLQHLSLGEPRHGQYILGNVFEVLITTNRTLSSLSIRPKDDLWLYKSLPQLLRANKCLKTVKLLHPARSISPTHVEHLQAISQALSDCPRYKALNLDNFPSPWTKAFTLIQDLHVQKVLAFAMGLNIRLGSESAVGQLKHDCVNAILMCYYDIPTDHFDTHNVKGDGDGDCADMVKLMTSFGYEGKEF
jgi:Ran GTPase-activating protein (RanGAP) involved in mRNA processing and transport